MKDFDRSFLFKLRVLLAYRDLLRNHFRDEDPSAIMQPEEVAEVICNLINPNEKCLDGQNIIIRKRMGK